MGVTGTQAAPLTNDRGAFCAVPTAPRAAECAAAASCTVPHGAALPVADPDLGRIIVAWPRLTLACREHIIALIDAALTAERADG